jgi:truncated hemoglobin YjbI
MSDDLIERLKDEAQRLSGYSLDHGRADAGIAANLADEAASRIEELERILAQPVDATGDYVHPAFNERDKERHRAEAAEAQVIAALQERDDVAVAAEALQQRIDETAARWAKWLNEQEALVEAREKVLRDALEPFAAAVDDGPDGWEINTASPTEDDWIRARAVVKGQP